MLCPFLSRLTRGSTLYRVPSPSVGSSSVCDQSLTLVAPLRYLDRSFRFVRGAGGPVARVLRRAAQHDEGQVRDIFLVFDELKGQIGYYFRNSEPDGQKNL